MLSLFDHFDIAAGLYGRMSPRSPDDGSLQMLALHEGSWLLDVGGGTGRVTATLRQKGVRVVVCDRSREMTRRARGAGFDTVRASADRLPFASGRVDGEIVVDAFHHFVDPTAAVAQPLAAAQLVRVLRPGGRLVIEEPDPQYWAIKVIAVLERLLLMRSRILAERDLASIFQAAGARVVKSQNEGYSVRILLSKDSLQQDWGGQAAG